MSKNKLKTKSANLHGAKINAGKDTDEMLKMQTQLSKLRESLDCLFGYLSKKNIIVPDEFNAFLANKFMCKVDAKPTNNHNLQGTVFITYYDKEFMESVQ